MVHSETSEVFYRGRRFSLRAKKVYFLGRIRGLMFKNDKTEALLFDFSKECREPIHSLFVFFPFLALWLNKRNEILEYKVVRPFTFFVRPKKSFYRLIEIPINTEQIDKNELVDLLVGKERFKYN